MPLSLSLSSLSSRITRLASTGGSGNNGIRRLATSGLKTTSKDDGGLVSIYNGINKWGWSLMQETVKALGSIFTLDFSKIWSYCVSTYFFIFNFNWNTTDKALDDQIKQAEIAIAGAKGGLIGKSLGYAICGLVPTATIAVFNEAMAMHVLQELGEEAAEEIASSVAQLITLQLQQGVRMAFTSLYKNYRSVLRPAALAVAQLWVSAGMMTQESLDKANKKKNEPWSFAGAFDDSIDSIKDPIQQNYVEEFWDELGEACIEAGYIVAGGIDSYIAQQKVVNSNLLGEEKTVEILLNRDSDNSNP